jgi:hypothetical protein
VAEYWIAGNASQYHAQFVLENVSEYAWWDLGFLGERIPLSMENITLQSRNQTCSPCPFTEVPPNRITFDRGDYVLSFNGIIHNNHLLVEFDSPSQVLVHLPEGLDVRNPFLGSLSPGSTVTEEGTGVLIRWNDTRLIECRFYDPFRETLLYSFFTFWAVIAVVLLFPLLMTRMKRD